MTLRVRELFSAAVDLDPSGRDSFLDAECGDDVELRSEVESLLRADEAADGFLEPPSAQAAEAGTTRIGRYTLGRRIGRGGMGTVFEAKQDTPRRSVALKLLRAPFPSAAAKARFALEAEILGRLEHPGIARIYEAGTHDTELGSMPFLAMELIVDARSLGEHAAGLGLRGRLELIRSICDALHHAHQRGVIHRDLKPSNILVDGEGRPRIIDFGVAQATELDVRAATVRTEAGQLVGTLKYMSPEQCRGDAGNLDVRSDVYALGVVLYELLTGRLPYDVETVSPFEIPRVIRETPPRPPSTVDRSLRGDIDALVLTALDKDRKRRYASAAALGRDIERYLEGAPLEARRDHGLYVLGKTLWRYRVGVATAAAVLTAALVAFFVVTRMQADAQMERAAERIEAAEARAAQAELLRRQAYAYRIALAQRAAESGNPGRAKALLAACPEDLRSWEWSRLRRLSDESRQALPGHRGPARALALSTDGRMMASAGEDAAVRTFAREDATWREAAVLRGHTSPVHAVAFSPDGATIASGDDDGELRLWVASSGALQRSWEAHEGEAISALAWSPDGSLLAGGGHDQVVRLWKDGKEVQALRGHTDNVTSIAFVNDERVVSGSADRTLRLWHVDGGPALRTMGPTDDGVESLAVSPDGTEVASGDWESRVIRWDLRTGERIAEFGGHDDGVRGLAWPAPDTIVSGSRDDTIGIASPEGNMLRLRGHDLGVEAVVADGEGFVGSASLDGSIRVWDTDAPRPPTVFDGHESKIHTLAFTPDAKQLLTGSGQMFDLGGPDTTVRLWDAATGDELAVGTEHAAAVEAVAVSPDGRVVASGDRAGVLITWDAAKLTGARRLTEPGSRITGLVFVGERLYVGREDGVVEGWDGSTRAYEHAGAAPVVDVSVSAGAVAVDADGSVVAHPQGRRVASVEDPVSIAGRPDGAIAVGATDGRVTALHPDGSVAWSVTTFGRELRDLEYCMDGERIVTASRDYKVRLFDAERGEMYMVIGSHSTVATAVACNPKTNVVASAGFDYVIRLWR